MEKEGRCSLDIEATPPSPVHISQFLAPEEPELLLMLLELLRALEHFALQKTGTSVRE